MWCVGMGQIDKGDDPRSTTVGIITCTGRQSTSCIILNIVYNLFNNIAYYIYIHSHIKLITRVSYYVGLNIYI